MATGETYSARICWAAGNRRWSNVLHYRQMSPTSDAPELSLRRALIQPVGLNSALRDLVGAATRWVATQIRRVDPPNGTARAWPEDLPSLVIPLAPTAPIGLSLEIELVAQSATRVILGRRYFDGINATHLANGVFELVPVDLPQRLADALVNPRFDGATRWDLVLRETGTGLYYPVERAHFRCDLVARRRRRRLACGVDATPVA